MKFLSALLLSAVIGLSTYHQSIQDYLYNLTLPRHMQVLMEHMHESSPNQQIQYVRGDSYTGLTPNPWVTECLKAIGITDQDMGWCAGAVVWSLDHSGCVDDYPHTAYAAPWDRQCDGHPQIGDVVNICYKNDDGHIGGHIAFLYAFADNGDMYILGGNQRFSVNIFKIKGTEVTGFIHIHYVHHDFLWHVRKAIKWVVKNS